MWALLRKDLPVLLVALVAAIVASITHLDPHRVFVVPGDRSLADFAIGWWVGGALLGLYLGGFDYVARTGEYLLHRSLSRKTIVLTRLGVGLTFGALIVAVPLLYCAVRLPQLWEYDLAEPYRLLPQHLALGLVFWSSFGATFFAVTVRGSFWKRVIFIALAFSSILFAILGTIIPWGRGALEASLGAHVALHLALTLVFCWGARAEFLAGDDRDRAMPTRWLVPSSIALTAMVSISGVSWLSGLQSEVYQMLLWRYPVVRERDNGDFVLLRRTSTSEGYREVPVNERHAPTGESADTIWRAGKTDLDDARRLTSPWAWEQRRWRSQNIFFDGVWDNWGRTFGWGGLYFRPQEGRVYLASFNDRRPPPGGIRWTRLRRGDDDTAFSVDTVVLGPPERSWSRSTEAWSGKSLVADRADGSLWFATDYRKTPSYARVPLPGDDTFRNFAVNERNEILVRGAAGGTYRWNGSGFDPVPDAPKAFAHSARPRDDVRLTEDDLLTPILEIDRRGREPFQHRYGLFTVPERLLGGVLFSATALRPPILNVWSFASDARVGATGFHEASVGWDADPASAALDPLLAFGRRPWLLGLQLVVCVFLGALAARRLRALGGSGGRAGLWCVLLLVGGPLVYLLYRSIETQRAWTPAQIIPAGEEKSLLIRSA